MKTAFLLLLSFLLATVHVSAERVNGQIIYEQDTVEVTFVIPFKFASNIPAYARLQKKVTYFDANGNKHKLKAGQAKEIRFTYGLDKVRMVSVPKHVGLGKFVKENPHIFLKLEIDGKLQLFRYYIPQSPFDYFTIPLDEELEEKQTTRYYLKKEGQDFLRPTALNFRKEMVAYLSDCPGLTALIANRDLGRKDLITIIESYNTSCGSSAVRFSEE